MTKKFSVQDIIGAIRGGFVARRVYSVSFVNDKRRKYYYCPLVTFAQKCCNFCDTPIENVVEYLVSHDYNADLLWGFIYGFDGRKLNEDERTDDFLDGYRIGVEVYQYCKKNNLIIFGGGSYVE
jgi:hypothetical protein